MRELHYVTVDVFTERVFGGNPLAVVLDGTDLSPAQMQAIATEFNYSETTFVLPPRAAAHSAWVRIFTPRIEVPFAGHPNVGTAVVLAREWLAAGREPGERFLFEEAAGIVPVSLWRTGSTITGAEFTAPEALRIGARVDVAQAAACLTLPASAIRTATHAPCVVSVGLPFLLIELEDRAALARASGSSHEHARVLPGIHAEGVYCYVRPEPQRLEARMFAPLDAVIEDPATGSATAAALACLASLDERGPSLRRWHVEQGRDMGRPSLLEGRTERTPAGVTVHVGGCAAPVMRGVLRLP